MRRSLLSTAAFGLLVGFVLVPQILALAENMEQATAPDRSWSAGGTLHDATLTEWDNASLDNQLATAADWALAFPSVRVALEMRQDPEELRGFASTLRRCVTKAATLDYRPAEPPRTSEIAARCAVVLGWVSFDESAG